MFKGLQNKINGLENIAPYHESSANNVLGCKETTAA
jgi:hypothetical protein